MTAAKLYAGIEAGGTKFNCIIGTGPNDIRARSSFPTTSPSETLEHVRQFLATGIAEHGAIHAIGIGSFGPVELDTSAAAYGSITSTPKPGWSDTILVGYFTDHFQVPVGFDTDVNAAALGEHLHGAAKGINDFVYVTIGTGVGAGAMANGKLIHGQAHPEAGHMLVPHDLRNDPFPGTCPFHRDCLEGLAAGPAIEARWGSPGRDLGFDHPAWDLEAGYLAMMCLNLAMCYSPRRIILGGGVMTQQQLLPIVREKFAALINGYLTSQLPDDLTAYIVPPGLGGDAGLLGALALAVQANH